MVRLPSHRFTTERRASPHEVSFGTYSGRDLTRSSGHSNIPAKVECEKRLRHIGEADRRPPQAQRGEWADPLTLDANYVRRTDAELHWKES